MKTTSCLRSDVPFRSPFWACSRSRSPASPKRGIDRPAVAAPQGLRAFLLRTDEAPKHEFNRTPSFAWLPVRGALRYEFELATSRSFSESSIIWSNTNDELAEETTTTTAAGGAATATGSVAEKMKSLYANLKSPTVSIDVALPWITGSPYALYAHVRAHTTSGPTTVEQAFRLQHSLVERPA